MIRSAEKEVYHNHKCTKTVNKMVGGKTLGGKMLPTQSTLVVMAKSTLVVMAKSTLVMMAKSALVVVAKSTLVVMAVFINSCIMRVL